MKAIFVSEQFHQKRNIFQLTLLVCYMYMLCCKAMIQKHLSKMGRQWPLRHKRNIQKQDQGRKGGKDGG